MSQEPFERLTPGDPPPGEPPSPELRALEAALASLAPRPAAIDRDRLMYAAGQASVCSEQTAPRRWVWPAAFSAASALAASLFLALLLRPPVIVERLVRAPVVAPAAESDDEDDRLTGRAGAVATGGAGVGATRRGGEVLRRPEQRHEDPAYLELRNRVLAMGIDAWQAPSNLAHAESPPPATYRDMLIELGELR